MPVTIRLLVGTCLGAVLASGSFVARSVERQAEPGRERYIECAGCHGLDRNEFGPKMCGVIGRKAGSVSGYPYSEAMKKADLTWTEAELDEFLKSPAESLKKFF